MIFTYSTWRSTLDGKLWSWKQIFTLLQLTSNRWRIKRRKIERPSLEHNLDWFKALPFPVCYLLCYFILLVIYNYFMKVKGSTSIKIRLIYNLMYLCKTYLYIYTSYLSIFRVSVFLSEFLSPGNSEKSI